MYPQEFYESLKRVEATRKARLNQVFPRLSMEERSALLEKFHPDYKKETMREISVGISKGEKTPHEFADLLEAYSYLDPKRFVIPAPKYEVDVLIIGGGGAGVAAALTASEVGADVLLVTKLRIGDANTTMAQGGIQAADKENDSPAIHYLDIMGGGGFKNIPELVRALVNDGPEVIRWLEELGVIFDKAEDGTMLSIHGGGTSRKRMHPCRDYTGAEIMRCLKDEFLDRKIKYIEYTASIELLKDNVGNCVGAVLVNMETGEVFTIKSKTTILATGGAGRLHIQGFPTSNHYGATGDGVVLAYRAGAKLIYLDTIQYHPTGVAFPEQILGQLITEKVRGLGAQLVNAYGEQFIYELETRDVVASAIIREVQERQKGVVTSTGGGVWLDTPLIEMKFGKGTIQKQLPAMYRQFIKFGIDMTQEPVLTYPTQHYQNGGILCNEFGETNVPNLYVAGEVSGGVHGRNRLMGNSLLDVLVFGRRAGRHAAEKSKEISKIGEPTLLHLIDYHSELKKLGIPESRRSPMILPDYRPQEFRGKFHFLSKLTEFNAERNNI
ncbi:MAG: FAD-binding protein [candidate division WOR-3 bacterium]|nr:FAD-binding protein [candidate division WOR-3 bacterium]MCX7757479.1 FAD-binding protein [candidate division WOR-3 bacterium]MDW7987142.1 FAD-binding protein [candidate division WOR-3 bacterium]